MKRLLTAAALGAVLAPAPSGASASIGNTDMQICNSVDSTDFIYPHASGQSLGNGLAQGQCGTYHNNNGQLRVYIESQSYRYGTWGQGYGACKNAPWDSDPPNSANGSTQVYKDYRRDNCVN